MFCVQHIIATYDYTKQREQQLPYTVNILGKNNMPGAIIKYKLKLMTLFYKVKCTEKDVSPYANTYSISQK